MAGTREAGDLRAPHVFLKRVPRIAIPPVMREHARAKTSLRPPLCDTYEEGLPRHLCAPMAFMQIVMTASCSAESRHLFTYTCVWIMPG